MAESSDKKIKWTEEKSWDEFRATGLFIWINRLLHTFGWALEAEGEPDPDNPDEFKATRVYPVRCRYRGFDGDSEKRMWPKLARWIRDHAEELVADTDLPNG